MNRILPFVLQVYEVNNQGRRNEEQFLGGKSVNFVTPKPKNFPLITTDFTWITDVAISGYQPPRQAPFGPATVVTRNYDTAEIRVTRTGLAYFCPNNLFGWGDLDTITVRPTLHMLEPMEVFTRVFDPAGYSIRHSDKGKYHLQCVERFGTLEDFAEFLKSEVNRNLLQKYQDRNVSKIGEGDYVNGRRYLDFEAIVKIVGNDDAAISLIEDLVDKSVFRRGFLFQCERCLNCDW